MFPPPRHVAFLAALLLIAPAAGAQVAAEDALDPASPMAPLPDLGVAWPDPGTGDDGAALAADPTAIADAAAEQRYGIAITGIDEIAKPARETEPALRARFDLLSVLEQGKDNAANVAQIDRRAREDADLLRELLRADGYYDAAVETRVEARAAGKGILVTLAATPGPLYRFESVEVTGLDGTSGLREAFAVNSDDPVDADAVTAAEATLRARAGATGFPFAKIANPEIVVDHETRTATLKLAVDPGGERRFGRVIVAGDPLFGAGHIQRIARFRPGDRFDAARIDDLRRALIATGLVSTVRITPVPGVDPGVVDIRVALEPAPPRTIAAEAGYGTGEGARLEVSWQHRNLIRPEGAVTFRGVAGTREQLLGASLRRGNFGERDQVLTAQVSAANTRLDAYDARTFNLGAGIERQTNIIWQKTWTWSFGGEILLSDERDNIVRNGTRERRTFLIGAIPTSLAYDGSDDLLNPTTGYRLAGRLSPELSLQNGSFGYVRSQIDASGYQPVLDDVVLAARVRVGAISGAGRNRLAPSRRFYAGGGGSVRGYGYQDIGPRDANNDPIGGRSLAEFSAEARIRFGDFGVVPFVDGGNLYEAAFPRFTGLRYGAGLGARYYTSFGPIRVDVGTPLNPRSGDSRVAVYVSLGQAF
jgi:translocation and assembly module TamA